MLLDELSDQAPMIVATAAAPAHAGDSPGLPAPHAEVKDAFPA